MTRRIVGVVFGSESDIPHVKKVVAGLDKNGYKRNLPLGAGYPHGYDKLYGLFAGSVHRSPIVTLQAMKCFYDSERHRSRAAFITCIGLRDEASGCIAAYTGARVVAIPPDTKEYKPGYPSGIRVYPFSGQAERIMDIEAGLDWLEREFENRAWAEDDVRAETRLENARDKLDILRQRLDDGEIEFAV